MRLFRKSASRVFAVLAATFLVVGCESTLDVPSNEQTWGFIQTGALASAGAYVTNPNGQFFVGTLSSIPDSRVRPDSCIELTITPQNPLQVTFLDAGSSITTQYGTRTDTLPRVSTSSGTLYEKSSPVPFRPGDSLIVRIPGANGGFPASEIRARTAEAFTLDSLIVKASPAATQIRWTPATDPNSSLLVEFRYSSTGGTNFNQLIRCAFVDDGADSVLFRVIQPWAGQNPSARNVTYTRLRTNIVQIVGGFLEVISTFAVPTPSSP
jgi:hypothetical protein